MRILPDGPETQIQQARLGSHPARVVMVCNKIDLFFVKGDVIAALMTAQRT
jgi:hypothetical protein